MDAIHAQILRASGGRRLPHACHRHPEDGSLGEACPGLTDCVQELQPCSPCTLLRFVLKADGSSSLPFVTGNFQDVQCLPIAEVREDTLPLFALLHPQDFDRVLVSMTQAARTVTPWLQEYRILPPQGGVRWLRSCLVPHADGAGRVVGYGLVADITAEKKAREEMLALCDQGAVGIYRSTLAGRYLSANVQFARICGYDSAEEFLQSVESITDQCWVHPKEHAAVMRLLETHGSIQRYALEMRVKGGGTVWVSLNVRAVRDAQGRVECCEGYCADITEQVLRESRAGWCTELVRTRFGQEPGTGLPETQKPAGASHGGLCHLLAYVRECILWRARLPMLS